MKCYIYVLRSLKDKRHYIGYTTDIDRRIADHNRGKSKSVKGRGPFELLYTEECVDEDTARTRERQIKSFKGGNAFRKLVESTTPASSPSSSPV